MAATVWEAAPIKTLAAVRSYIQTQALYRADGGTCGGWRAPASKPRAPASGARNNRYGWDRINLPAYPTAVLLAAMAATGQADAIEVTWETVSEVNNAGFNLYRDSSPAGPGVKLNTSLIPSRGSGSPEGYHYTYLDRANLVPNTTYYYWLEDVNTAGFATRHEPVSVLYTGGPTAVRLAEFDATTIFLPRITRIGRIIRSATLGLSFAVTASVIAGLALAAGATAATRRRRRGR